MHRTDPTAPDLEPTGEEIASIMAEATLPPGHNDPQSPWFVPEEVRSRYRAVLNEDLMFSRAHRRYVAIPKHWTDEDRAALKTVAFRVHEIRRDRAIRERNAEIDRARALEESTCACCGRQGSVGPFLWVYRQSFLGHHDDRHRVCARCSHGLAALHEQALREAAITKDVRAYFDKTHPDYTQ